MPISTNNYPFLYSDGNPTGKKSVDTVRQQHNASAKPADITARSLPWGSHAGQHEGSPAQSTTTPSYDRAAPHNQHDTVANKPAPPSTAIFPLQQPPAAPAVNGKKDPVESDGKGSDPMLGHPPTRPLNAEEHSRVMGAVKKAVNWLKSAISKLGKPETWTSWTKRALSELIPGGLNSSSDRKAFSDRLTYLLSDLERVQRSGASNISAGDDLNGAVADAHLFDDIHISTHSLKTATPDALAAMLIHEDSHLSIRSADNWYVKPEVDNANSPSSDRPYFSNFKQEKEFTAANALDNAATIQMATQVLADRPLASMKYWDDSADSNGAA